MFIFLSAQSQTVIEMKQESGIYTIPCKVNGLKLRFIFDTGASNVSMSLSEILFMLKNDYISKDDIYGVSEAQLANGDIVENTEVLLREIEIGGIVLKDVKANIIHEIAAPLLLGQSAIEKLGTYQIDGSKLIINNGPSSSSKIYDYNDVVLSDGWRDKSTMELITGEIIEVKNGIKIFHVNKVENGKVNGYAKEWYENGQLKSVIKYKNNKRDGLWETWWENGAKFEEEAYVNGEWNGKYKKWYKSGAIESERNYVNGKEHGLFKWWYENGAIHSEHNYSNGKENGHYKTWYERTDFLGGGSDGHHLEWDWNYKNGKKDGVCKSWHENGTLEEESIYSNGSSRGSSLYDSNGKLTKKLVYKDKKMVSALWRKPERENSYINDFIYVDKYEYVGRIISSVSKEYIINGVKNAIVIQPIYLDKEGNKTNNDIWIFKTFHENGNLKTELHCKPIPYYVENAFEGQPPVEMINIGYLPYNIEEKSLEVKRENIKVLWEKQYSKDGTLISYITKTSENDISKSSSSSSIIIGSFGAMSNAERQKQTLIKEGFNNIDISKVGNVNRVSILISGSKEDAQEILKKVKVNHKSAWISYN